ncbi:MAG: cadherin-like domain-containing protein, partial [Prosthecobacter sp.]|nr:cadherin-like domain-containing protein [Prosthecobacter sp.]
AANFYGEDSFAFKANDGLADSNTATITLTINAVNDAPLALAQSVTTPDSIPLVITLTGGDVETSDLEFNLVDLPLHGSLSGAIPNLTYTSVQGYSGSDSFTFEVNDGELTSGVVTVS